MRRVSKNFLSLFISDAVSRILGFIATVYIARLLAAEGFGLVSYGMAFVTYALLFTNPGLTTIGAREIAKDSSNKRLIEEILGLRLTLSVLILILFIIGLLILPGNPVTKKVILLYLFSLFPFAILLEFVFQGREEMGYIGFSRVLQYGVYVLLVFILLSRSRNVLAVPTSFSIGYAAAAGFLIIVFLHKYRSIKIGFSLNFWRNLLAMATPVGIAIIFNQLSLNLPPLILGIVHSKAEVGFFSAAFKIIVMLQIIERVFYYVFFPVLSKQYTQRPERLKYSFSSLTKLLIAITIPLAFGGIVLADKIIYFVYGAGFERSITIFRILLLYFLITPINTIFGYGLVAIDKERRFFRIMTYTALVNLILVIILGINFKVQGAAVALFISEIFGVLLMNRELKKFVKFESLKYVVRPILAFALMGVGLYLFRNWHVVILIIVGVIVYTLLLLLIRGFSREELRKMKQQFVQK